MIKLDTVKFSSSEFYNVLGVAGYSLYLSTGEVKLTSPWYEKGAIRAGAPANRFGDRPCTHHERFGTFTLKPKVASGKFPNLYQIIPFGAFWINENVLCSCHTMSNYYLIVYTTKSWNGTWYSQCWACGWTVEPSRSCPTAQSLGYLSFNGASATDSASDAIASAPGSMSGSLYPWSLTATSPPVDLYGKVTAELKDPDVSGFLRYYRGLHFPTPEIPWRGMAELGNDAANNARPLDINGIAYVKDILNVVSDIRRIDKLVSSAVSASTVASAYLNYQYGLRLTLSDTVELGKRLRGINDHLKDGTSVVRASSVHSVGTATAEEHLKVYYNPLSDACSSFLSAVDSFDALPTLENIWDMVPYSFVVDWFLGVGDLLGQVDNMFRVERMGIISCVYSQRVSCQRSFEWEDQLFVFEERTYTRSVLRHLPDPPFRLSSDVSGILDHLAEGTALIIAKF